MKRTMTKLPMILLLAGTLSASDMTVTTESGGIYSINNVASFSWIVKGGGGYFSRRPSWNMYEIMAGLMSLWIAAGVVDEMARHNQILEQIARCYHIHEMAKKQAKLEVPQAQ